MRRCVLSSPQRTEISGCLGPFRHRSGRSASTSCSRIYWCKRLENIMMSVIHCKKWKSLIRQIHHSSPHHCLDHNSDVSHRVRLLPGENIAGARPATASCLFLVKSEIFQTKMPSYVAADISLIFPSISTMDRSLRLTVLSS